jgi:autotransporter-associated beta strand protein
MITPPAQLSPALDAHVSKRRRLFVHLATICFAIAGSPALTHAATIVSAPEVILTFDGPLAPDVSDWSTANVGGGAADILDSGTMDARVASLSAAQINTPLQPSTTAGGSGTNALARYNSTEMYLSTRPTAVAFTPLMATLQNEAGGRITDLAIEYDLGAYAPTAPDTDLEGHRVYYSLDGAVWTPINALSNIGTPQRLSASVNVASWEQGSLLYFLWVDDNGNGTTDGGFTIDNVRLVPTVEPIIIGRSLTYNLSHGAGGAPNGSIATTGNYFLEGNTPTAFATNDVVTFSQDGSATISVPSDVVVGGIIVSSNTGTYTFTGPGKITGQFTKSNPGTAVFTSANNFTKSTISGGVVETQADGLGLGTVTLSNNALWKVTTVAQSHNGSLLIDTGGAIIQTDSDLTAGGLNGAALLTKTGAGKLTLLGGGSGTGGIDVQAGQLALGGPVGGATQTIALNGHPLEFVNTGEITFSDTVNTRTINLGATGGTISVTNAGAGVVFAGPDTLLTGGTIVKEGDGALRMRADHFLTNNWMVNAGTLEAGAFGSALGSGTVTVNVGGRIASQNTVIPNNITLAGGELATRSGDAADFIGQVDVTADAVVGLRSYTTPANGQHITISGVLSGSGGLTISGAPGSNPNGAKALILTNVNNTFSGTISVNAEQSLIVTGNLVAASHVQVDGRLGGNGTVGNVAVNAFATLAPGLAANTAVGIVQPNPVLDAIGIFSIARDLTLANGSILALDLDHGFGASPAPGTDYDQLVIGTGSGLVSTGAVTLDGGELVLTIGFSGVLPTDRFFILTNDGTDAITGTFNGLPDKSLLTLNGQGFQISYNADVTSGSFTGGNDVALFAIPEPGTVGLLLVGTTLLIRRRQRR